MFIRSIWDTRKHEQEIYEELDEDLKLQFMFSKINNTESEHLHVVMYLNLQNSLANLEDLNERRKEIITILTCKNYDTKIKLQTTFQLKHKISVDSLKYYNIDLLILDVVERQKKRKESEENS